MKIYFRHYSGAIMEYDYLFFDCMASVPAEDEDKALVEGWLPDDYFNPKNDEKSHWYQARQTRICLNKFLDSKSNKKTRKKCKNILTKVIRARDVEMDILNCIFEKYIKYRNIYIYIFKE